MHNSYIVFDIETGPRPGVELEQFKPAFNAPSNYKDPEKIKANILEQEQEWYAKAALSPVTGQVLAVGFAWEGIRNTEIGGEEKDLIIYAWERLFPDGASTNKLIGFCTNTFDLPFLARRSWMLGVKVPYCLMQGRYLNPLCIDLAEIWQMGNKRDSFDKKGNSSKNSINLDTLAKFFGVGQKTGHGADFARLMKEDINQAREYLKNDLVLTEKCAQKMGII